jgi:hypothetical protein
LTINKRGVSHGWNENNNDCAVILNSISNICKAKSFLEQQFTVCTFLDNDEAGKRAAAEIKNIVKSGHPVWDGAQCYAAHKDLNDYLMSMPKPKQALGNALKI